jgi:hypothetical protein
VAYIDVIPPGKTEVGAWGGGWGWCRCAWGSTTASGGSSARAGRGADEASCVCVSQTIIVIVTAATTAAQVHFKLFVPQEQFKLGAPTLKGFKATGFPGGNLPKTGPGAVDAGQAADCDILGNCDDLEAEAAIR